MREPSAQSSWKSLSALQVCSLDRFVRAPKKESCNASRAALSRSSVRYSIGSHHQLETMQAWQQITGHIVVPKVVHFPLALALLLPLRAQRLVNPINDFDQKRARPSRRSSICTNGSSGLTPCGIVNPLYRVTISPHVVVSARPSSSPNSVRKISSTLRTMKLTTGRGV